MGTQKNLTEKDEGNQTLSLITSNN